ncbi:ribonuclease H-like domain-containing protein [Clostridium sp. MSJ-4]|uniref:Ribonuclease H-like domain-containing protein n=1 Tax=Clostridium simiarum TaxID=2841506 RepID=A0ABS6EWC1_9CLOT|nr:ribonuclease H-like domain-containing protein [Clostridium simiarum]
MIIRENTFYVDDINLDNVLDIEDKKDCYESALFFDLEHYVYKKPICIGVFGCCYYDKLDSSINVTQYMIENKNEAVDVLFMAESYFQFMMKNKNKHYIVTFSGNNDFTVIKYLFNKYNIDFNFDEHFVHVDLQREYEKQFKNNIGLKNLEKLIGIEREGEVVNGANLAKTFSKVVKDKDYIKRMPEDKIERILLYNEQDVINLFHIYTNWGNLSKQNEDSEI